MEWSDGWKVHKGASLTKIGSIKQQFSLNRIGASGVQVYLQMSEK